MLDPGVVPSRVNDPSISHQNNTGKLRSGKLPSTPKRAEIEVLLRDVPDRKEGEVRIPMVIGSMG